MGTEVCATPVPRNQRKTVTLPYYVSLLKARIIILHNSSWKQKPLDKDHVVRHKTNQTHTNDLHDIKDVSVYTNMQAANLSHFSTFDVWNGGFYFNLKEVKYSSPLISLVTFEFLYENSQMSLTIHMQYNNTPIGELDTAHMTDKLIWGINNTNNLPDRLIKEWWQVGSLKQTGSHEKHLVNHNAAQELNSVQQHQHNTFKANNDECTTAAQITMTTTITT